MGRESTLCDSTTDRFSVSLYNQRNECAMFEALSASWNPRSLKVRVYDGIQECDGNQKS